MQITGHGDRMHGNRRSFGLYLAHSTQYGVDSPSPAVDVTLVDAAPSYRSMLSQTEAMMQSRPNCYAAAPVAERPTRDLEAKVGSFSLDPRPVELVKTRASQINDCTCRWQRPSLPMMAIDRWNHRLPTGSHRVHWKAPNRAAN